MLALSSDFNCRNFSTRLFGITRESRMDPIDEPGASESAAAWKLDMGTWSKPGDHSISFQTEFYPGAVEAALAAPGVASGGTTVKDSTLPGRDPQQIAGLGFDAKPRLTAKGYFIDQGIRAQRLGSGLLLGTVSVGIFFSPLPGTFLARQSERVEEMLSRKGYLPPTAA